MTFSDARRVRRRFLILSATRWFPVGLMIPVLTVLLQERGLSLATIGLLSGLSSAVVVLLELPTGGLADTIGRRPVLLLAGFLSLLLDENRAPTTAAHRATMVSVNSLTSRIGGMVVVIQIVNSV